MVYEHPDAELAPRDTVSRAIWRKRLEGLEVYLDARSAIGNRFPKRFPTAFNTCQEIGINPVTDLIPVCPAAHYHVGGISTDLNGRASLEGLWASGEVASTRLHGANRLASNSLLEAMVFGLEVGRNIKTDWRSRIGSNLSIPEFLIQAGPESLSIRGSLQQLMWENVGLVRNETSLNQALEEIAKIEEQSAKIPGELKNMLLAARLITQSALERKESRGVHYRSDFPETSDQYADHLYVTAPHSLRIAEAK
jgi:L-aspartate oxidase